MNIHQLLDEFAISFGGIYGESMKFFNREAQSEPIKEIINSTEISECSIVNPGEYEVEAVIGNEKLTLRYYILTSFSPNQPVLIFHHGSGDQPYHRRIRKIIDASPESFSNCTVIATDSPYNRTRKEYFHAIGSLRNFTRILAVSSVLIEKLVQAAASRDVKRITVSGISLGGWITNIHHAYFNTAGQYRPVFAGGAPDSLFLNSAYSKMTSFRKLTDSSLLREVLNFEDDFRHAGNDNVFPLLAAFDRYIVLERQRAVYDDHNISLTDKGHITGSADRKMIARFLGESLVSSEINNIK